MWFDLVLVDQLTADGELASVHIRAKGANTFPVERLEDIHADYRPASVADVAGLRIHATDKTETTVLKSRLRNFEYRDGQLCVQLDHINLPCISGYYGIVFPVGWRLHALSIYDPYDAPENASDKKPFRGRRVVWDPSSRTNLAQLYLQSIRRGSFSLGVIAVLRPDSEPGPWIDEPGAIGLEFHHHKNHPLESAYTAATSELTSSMAARSPMPGVEISFAGPSLDLVAWGRYLRDRLRRPGAS